MNFLAPQMLLGLLLIPVAIGFYLWAQRRRSKYAVRFTNLDLLANLAPRRPAWRRHLPPVLYLGAIAALLIGLARPTMVVADAARGRDGHPRHGRLGLDARDRRLADPARCRQGVGPARSSPSSPRASASGSSRSPREPVTLVSPTTDRGAAQAGHRRPDRPRRDGHGRRPDAGPRHRREDPDRQRHETPDATAAPSAAATGASAAPGASGAPSAPTDQPSGQPLVAAILLSDGANSVGQAEPLDAAAARQDARRPDLHHRPRHARRPGRTSRTSSDRTVTLDVPPDTETLDQIASITGAQGVQRTDGRGPRQRLRQPRSRASATPKSARKSPSPSSAPGSCWSSSVPGSRRSGSAGCP